MLVMSRSRCNRSSPLCAVLHALPAALLFALSNASPRGRIRFKRLYCTRVDTSQSAALLNYKCCDQVGSAEVVQERSGRLEGW